MIAHSATHTYLKLFTEESTAKVLLVVVDHGHVQIIDLKVRDCKRILF